MHEPPVFWRCPRLRPPLPQKEIEVPAPPTKPTPPGSMLTMLLPAALTVGVMVGIGLLSGMSNWLLFMVPMMLASSMASIVTHHFQKRKHREKEAERKKKYEGYLEELTQDLSTLGRAQLEALSKKDPSASGCLEIVRKRRRNLWTRRPEDDDFLAVRLGLGTVDSTVTVKMPKDQNYFEPDPLIQSAHRVADRFGLVSGVPICVSLREHGVTGFAGPRGQVLMAIRSLVIQIATHHSPDEVKIVALYPREEEAEWRWLRWLPHVWSDDHKRRFLACDRDAAHRLLGYLNDLLDERDRRSREKASAGTPPAFPFSLVVLLAARELTEGEPLVQRLQAEGSRLSAYPVFVRDRFTDLPPECEAAARFGIAKPFYSVMRSQTSYYFRPDEAPIGLARSFSGAMAPIRLKRPASPGDVPSLVTLLDLEGVRFVEELYVGERWEQSQTSGRSLAVPIGLRAGSEPLVLDLHERVHGPNGLIAGMVGAGKSELIQAVVASLAIHFHPHRVAFILIDYKGGGMADPFVSLPHCLGTITNLQEGSMATRSVTSLNVESERRQRLFRQAGVNHIDDYQRLYYEGKVKEPLPYLVIIVDEFADMKTERPEVAKEFVRIARLGRALGFRLILAMQKPAGIVDGQIEANTRFRLCLRVAQIEDSRAMLGRPEAAHLGGIGRAYFQVGVNEVFQLFQVAWSGAPYDPKGAGIDDPLEITEIELDGSRISRFQPARDEAQTDVSQLTAVVAYLVEVAKQNDIERLPSPWLEPLPEQLALDKLARKGGWNGKGWDASDSWMDPVIGLLDDPGHQRQGELKVDLGREGHLVVYSAPGFGKTTLVQTLITSLALSYSPADVQIYLLDFGGSLLRVFEPLPHVGAVITLDEDERLHRLLRHLLKEMDRRKELFGKAGVTILREYRASGDSMPAIVTVLDNYAAFVEAYEDDEETLIQIAREGGNLGIHLILTANSSSAIRYKLTCNVTMAVALHLVEEGEYGGILGRTDGLVPKAIPGRGLLKGSPAMEFQTALPVHGDTESERGANLKTLIKQVAETWTGPVAPRIKTLPDVVALFDILESDCDWQTGGAPSSPELKVPLGLDVLDLAPFSVDLSQTTGLLVTGPMGSGKTTLLQTWVLALASRFAPSSLCIYLMDSRRMGLSELKDLPHVEAYSCDEAQTDEMLRSLSGQLHNRREMVNALRRGQGSSLSTGTQTFRVPALVMVVDDCFDQFDDTTTEASREHLTALVRQGRGLGFHLILAGSSEYLSRKLWDEPISTLRAGRVGFLLGTTDDSIFDLRLPFSERGRPMPPGVAYWTQQGQSCKVKIATASSEALSMKEWVQRLTKRAQNVRAESQKKA